MPRQVYPRPMVAHLWANASQDSARDPSGNMYFTGPALYSYGSHYCIGYRYATADGSPIYLMNADSSTNTTNRMRWIAHDALPRYLPTYAVENLKGETFHGQGWRGHLLRSILSQAGNAYARAADVARVSGKRDAAVRDAAERMRAARALADAILADKSLSRDDRAAARAALRTLERVPAWDATADNKTQQANATACAAVLVRDEMKAEMLNFVRRATREHEKAMEHDQHSIVYRIQCARYAVNAAGFARDLARRYGFRLPKLPDSAALVCQLEPAEREYMLREAAYQARSCVETVETAWRDRAGAWAWRIESAARNLADHVRGAKMMGAPETVPAAWSERVAALYARSQRAESIAAASRTLNNAAPEIASADSYAAAGRARDAVRRYRRAISLINGALDALPPTHPLAARARSMVPDRDRAAAYVADADSALTAEHAQRIADWRAGGAALPWGMRDSAPMLRLSRDGSVIETSHGASVPASVAPRLWRMVTAARAGAADAITAQHRGMRIGHFTLQTVRPDGSLLIGCHDIAFDELQRLADVLGLTNDNKAAA